MQKSISKNAVFKAILNMFNIILPIVVMPVITHALSGTNYSYITTGETFNTILVAFASFGVYQYGLREISNVRDDEKKLRQTFTSLFVITIFTTIIVFILYILYLYKFYYDNPAFYTCFIMGFNIVFNLFYVEWVNEALENYDFIAVKTMVVKTVYSLVVLFCIRENNDFLFYVYLGVAINLVNNILSYFYIKKRIKFNFSNLKIRKYIKPLFLVVILSNTSLLYTQLDRLLIIRHGSDMDLSAYGIAQKGMYMINALMLTIIQVTMPRLSNNLSNDSKENYINLLQRVIKIYYLFLFPASIGLFCVSKQVMRIFNKSYVPWYYVMSGFAIYMLTVGIQGIISNQIIYLNRYENEDVKIFLLGGICNLVINEIFILIGDFTPANSILVTAFSNMLVIVLEYIVVRKKIKLDIRLFSFENMKYFYYSLLFIPVTLIINNGIDNFIISCSLDIIICGLLYLGILMFTKDKTFFEIYSISILKAKSLITRLVK